MRKFDRLKAEAKAASVNHGHSMSVFRTVAEIRGRGYEAIAECADCGAWATVDSRWDIGWIDGDAVALDCTLRTNASQIVNDPDISPQAKKWANYTLTKWEAYNDEGIDNENAGS